MEKRVLKKVLCIHLMLMAIILSGSTKALASGEVNANKIPDGIVEASKKIGLWRDIYTSPKKVILYSYMPGSTCPYQSQEFHNKMNSAASRSGGKYITRPTGPSRLNREVSTAAAKIKAKIKKAEQSNDPNAIKNVRAEINEFNKLVTFTNKCTVKACIINPSKGEYVMMNRNSEQALETIKNY